MLAVRQVELRLVVQVEIAAHEGGVQFGFDPLPVVGDLAHVGMEHRPVADAAGAGILQRQVGAAQDSCTGSMPSFGMATMPTDRLTDCRWVFS